jgi:L,D-transpeptidase catalytic domain
MDSARYLKNGITGFAALIFAGSQIVPGANKTGPVLTAAAKVVVGEHAPVSDKTSAALLSAQIDSAVHVLGSAVRPLSHAKALETAFRSYFAFLAEHPTDVKKSLLYFVDYGLPSTQPRGYLFDMHTLQIVEGPFTVAHGRGSSTSQYGVPTKFSNAPGSAATSLGLYLAENTYSFRGHTGGRVYSSIGLRLKGVSEGFNDNALARGVVAHGAPYVTPSKAGRSEGCPAMEPQRAERVLPELAEGGMVFLFGLDNDWMAGDPWVGASVN